jgi:myo-inositol 2-dehydrogenase / D-chiro-inositol 1-dehydrogenase
VYSSERAERNDGRAAGVWSLYCLAHARRGDPLNAELEPIRLGIVGTGFISAVHGGCARASAEIRLVAVASARGRATPERAGPDVDLLTTAELIGRPDIDAVLVCTRTSDHADHAVAALEAGKHLMLEKPGAISLHDHDRIAAAAQRHPRQVVRVAYHRRHDPAFCELARAVAAGAIGAPFAVQLASREDFPPSADDAPTGGFIMDVGVHDFDTARWLLGQDPDTASAVAHNPVYRDADLDNAYITVTHGGAVATTHLSRTSTLGMEIRCEVVGTEGSAMLAQAATGSGVTVLRTTSDPGFPADCRARFGAAYQAQIDAFAAACRGEETANATLTDDRWAVATAVAARASVARGSPLAVGPDWPWPAADPAAG